MFKHLYDFFIVQKGDPYLQGNKIPLDKEKIIIGRSWENWTPDIPFSSVYVSRKQAAIEYRDDCYTITDLSNRLNKFKVNGKILEKGVSHVLSHGDIVTFANDEVSLLFCKGIKPGETIDTNLNYRDAILTFNEKVRKFYISGREIDISGKCYTLFKLLYEERGRAVNHEVIKQIVWPERVEGVDGMQQVLDEEVISIIHRLKERLGPYDYIIENIRGYGYMLNTDSIPPKE